MSSFSRWQSGSVTLLALGTFAGAAAPLVVSHPASAQTSFSDVSSSYWARPFIEALASEGVISGFPDGTFRPDAPVTRAQFAAIIRQASTQGVVRSPRSFSDVPNTYWAAPAITKAYTTGFMSGYPNGTFLPDQQIPKVQALVSLASGLRLSPSGSTSNTLNAAYSDAGDIPSYATNGVAATTQKKIVVDYPNVKFLNPNETATRADVAAYIYQALVSQNKIQPLAQDSPAAQYIVGGTSSGGNQGSQNPQYTVAQGTQIPVQYAGNSNARIVVARGETLSNVTLETSSDIKNSKGQVLIPKGSRIVGDLRPVSVGSQVGTQFYSKQITIKDQTYNINATSGVVLTGQERPTAKGGTGQVVASSATKSVLGNLLGNQSLVQGILGALTGQQPSTTPNELSDFIYITPALDLKLKLDSAFDVG